MQISFLFRKVRCYFSHTELSEYQQLFKSKIIKSFFKAIVLTVCTLFCNTGFAQNVGISSSNTFVPDASAGLDINFNNKGLLIPRVALSATNVAGPIALPTASLLIYNTATAGTAPNNITPGYYYWTGSLWAALATAGSAWSINGNSGTSGGTNFLGTPDAIGLHFRTNNVQRMLLDSLGSVAVGNAPVFSTGNAREKFLVDAGSSTNPTPTGAFNVISGKGYLDRNLQLNIQNTSPTASASSDIVAGNNNLTETTNFINLGINSSGNTSIGVIGGASTGHLYATGNDFAIGNATSGKNLIFFTGGTGATERMRIDATGNVGIGATPLAYKLTIAGSVVPASDNVYNLGASNLRWNLIYTGNILQVSDRRMKTNIKTLNYGLKEVLALKPVSYNWKKNPTGENRIGLIAQDVRKLVPEVVKGDEAKETIGMNYAELVPVLINAIQEQQKEIIKQQKSLDDLKKNVQKLPK